MKKKGLVVGVGLVCVMALMALSVTSAQAAYAWGNLSASNFTVGCAFGMYYVVDTVGAIGTAGNYYVFDPANKNALYANALTAYSSGTPLSVFCDPTLGTGSVCYGAIAAH